MKSVSANSQHIKRPSRYRKKENKNYYGKGMNWNNHGKIWHLDHKIPCAAFDLSKPEQQAECFHFSNLQPLFAIENLAKSDMILPTQKELLLKL